MTAALLLEARQLAYSHAASVLPATAPSPPLFTGINLTVRTREIVCLLGASGCGKSTLLRVLAGQLPASAGRLCFLGTPLTAPDPRSAQVFQQASLLPWLDVIGNVGFGLDGARLPALAGGAAHDRVAQAIEAVGLSGLEHAYPAALSSSAAQRVALARSLVRQPRLLFADEPFSALDAIDRAEMQTLLVDLVHRWRSAVLLVTHDIDEAILVADRIVLMGGRPGRILREWQVDLPRPRPPNGAAVTALRVDILAALLGVRAIDLAGAPARR